jgi:hypothetical protein
MKNIFLKRFMLATFGLYSLLIVLSCGKDDLASPDAYSRIKIIHMAPLAGNNNVKVLINDADLLLRNRFILGTAPNTRSVDSTLISIAFGGSLPAGNFSIDSTYIGVPSGSVKVRLISAATNGVVLDGAFNVEAGKSYSIFAVDTPTVAALQIEDILPPVKNGTAGLRLGHLAQNAGAVDVTVVTRNRRARTTNDTFRFAGVNYKSFTSFNALKSGDSVIAIVARKANDTLRLLNASSSTSLLTLANGRNYTVLARGAGRTFQSLSSTTINHSR